LVSIGAVATKSAEPAAPVRIERAGFSADGFV
jgi:hypothetical protein